MPTAYQRDSLQAMLGLFLEAQGKPLPQHSLVKSASALSRFLNEYGWPTRKLVQFGRQAMLRQLLQYAPKGRRPWLQVMVDLTTLQKCGKFKAFAALISVLQGKRGLHLVVLYLVVGEFRVPWAFRVWRGKDQRSAAQLAIRMVGSLPKALTRAFRVIVLADTAFGSVEFLKAMRKKRLATIVGVRCNRKLSDGRSVCDLVHKGQQVYLEGLDFPVTISWLYLKRDGKLEKRFVLSTRPLKGSTITWWGRRRWGIEGFFKTIKHRFGLHRFGQQTLKGLYRWLVLCFISFVLTHWVYRSTHAAQAPDWQVAATTALHTLFPEVVAALALIQLEQARPLLYSLNIDVQFVYFAELKT